MKAKHEPCAHSDSRGRRCAAHTATAATAATMHATTLAAAATPARTGALFDHVAAGTAASPTTAAAAAAAAAAVAQAAADNAETPEDATTLRDCLVASFCQHAARVSPGARRSATVVDDACVAFLAVTGNSTLPLDVARNALVAALAFYDFAKEWENGRVKGSNGSSWFLLSATDAQETLRDRRTLGVISEHSFNALSEVLTTHSESRMGSVSESFVPLLKHTESSHTSGTDQLSGDTSQVDTINDIAQQLITLKFATDVEIDSKPDNELSAFMSEIAPFVHTRYYKQGDILCQEGEQAKAMFFILKGTVQVTSGDGEIVYAELEPVAYFGEIGILYNMNRTATVSAKTKCTIAVLKATDFKSILEKYEGLSAQLFKEAEHRLMQLKDRNSENTTTRSHSKDVSYSRRSDSFNDASSPRTMGPLGKAPSDERFFSSPELKTTNEDYSNGLKLVVPQQEFSMPKSPSFSSLIPHSSPSSIGEYPDEVGRAILSNHLPLLSILKSPSIDSCSRSSRSRSVSLLNLAQPDDVPGMDSMTVEEPTVINTDNTATVMAEQVPSSSTYDSDEDPMNDYQASSPTAGRFDTFDGNNGGDENNSPVNSSSSEFAITSRSQTLVSQAMARRRGSIAPWAEGAVIPQQPTIKLQLSIKRSATTNDDMYSHDSDVMPTAEILDRAGGVFSKAIMVKIASYCDFKTLCKMSKLSKDYHAFISDYNPTKLDLSSINKSVTDKVLEEILAKHGKNIQHLFLTNCWELSNEATQSISRYGSKIRTLSLANSWNISDAGLENLKLPLCKKVSLTNLRKIRSQGVVAVIDSFNVRTITLSYCKSIGNDLFMHPNWMLVEHADFSRCTGISDEGFLAWPSLASDNTFDNLVNNPNEMDIPRISTTPSSSIPVFAMKSLFLNDCSFLTSQVLECIFPIMPYLETLSLSFCCALSYLPPLPPKVKNLDLSFCPLATDELVETLTNLKIIGLRGCVCISGMGLWSLRKGNFDAIGYSGNAVLELKEIDNASDSEKFPWHLLKSSNVFDHLAIKI